jgi:YegS/Rv2252/BmrU family lipid kinase
MNGLYFIINPAAGHGRAINVWKKVKRELERKKVSYRSFYTEYPGHAEVLARQVAIIQNYHLKTIIGVGGDGTIHEIVNGLSSFNKIQIGFISAGSGNDFARGFQLPTQPVKAIKFLLQRLNKPVNQYDLGEFRLEGKKNGHYFINRVGIGLHVDREKVSENITIKRFMAMLHLEDMMFVISFLKVLIYYQPSSLEVSVDEDLTTYNNVWFLMISNIPTYQGRMKIATKANPTDGNLDVTIVSNISRFQLIILVF